MRNTSILTVDQLPDSRRSILLALKQTGPATIAELAERLQLTGEAVRQQLLQLRRDGWIETKQIRRAEERGRIGRPATVYRLSESGDHLFPKDYDVLTIAMIDAIAEKLGPDAVTNVLERLAEDRAKEMMPLMDGLSLPEKVDRLKNWYSADDPFMTAEEDGSGYRLIERNCPFLNAAMRRPTLCSISVNALSRLLGVRVVRDEKFQNGDGRCVFRVKADEPIDAASWKFKLE